jgi:hypothetical protein
METPWPVSMENPKSLQNSSKGHPMEIEFSSLGSISTLTKQIISFFKK